MTGTIRTINLDKGFGFIQGSDGDFFFHRSSVQPPDAFGKLQLGQKVEFTAQDAPKGPRAEHVRVV